MGEEGAYLILQVTVHRWGMSGQRLKQGRDLKQIPLSNTACCLMPNWIPYITQNTSLGMVLPEVV